MSHKPDGSKWKRLTVLAAILGVFLGAGGMVGLFQLLYEAPLRKEEMTQGLRKEAFEIEMDKHESYIHSLQRSIEALDKTGQRDLANQLVKQLYERELLFRDYIDSDAALLRSLNNQSEISEEFRTKVILRNLETLRQQALIIKELQRMQDMTSG